MYTSAKCSNTKTKTKLSNNQTNNGNPNKMPQFNKLLSNNKSNLKKGLNQEMAKKLGKAIRDQLKKINVSIQGESLRVAGKNKDDLQAVIALIRAEQENLEIPLQFENFR